MEFDYLFLWIVGISTWSLLIRFFRQGIGRYKSWVVAAVLVVFIELAAISVLKQGAGFISLISWFLLLVAPSLLSRKLASSLLEQDFTISLKLSRALAFLHPSSEYRSLPALILALSEFEAEQPESSLQKLEKLAAQTGSLGLVATVQSMALCGKWQELAEWVESRFSIQELLRYPAIIPHYLRALGEQGKYAALLHSAAICQQAGLFNQPDLLQAQYYLMIFAFSGRADLVAELLAHQLHMFPDEVKDYWLATVNQTSNLGVNADAVFFQLAESSNPSVRYSARHRIHHRLPVAAQIISEGDKHLLAKLCRVYQEPEESDSAFSSSEKDMLISYILIGLSGLVYLYQLYFIQIHPDWPLGYILFELGALLPQAVYQDGEWWRVFSAMFLHGSFAHLCTNMLGIFILGPAVEARYGRLRMLFIYIISGIGSLYLVMHLTLLGYLEESLLVGASGAIMGLIGALAAPLILQSVRTGIIRSNHQLRSILVILGIQIVFDLSTPQVSSPAHLGGFFTGLVFGFALRSK